MKTDVLIADDQELVRAGLRVILESAGVDVLGEAGDGHEAVELALELRPDVVLMDVRMPVLDGIEATRRIRRQPDAPRVLIVTTFDLDEYVFEALRAGASGFLLKDAPRAELLRAIDVIAAGDALLTPTATRRLVEEFARYPAASAPPTTTLDALTPREQHVLTLMAKGRTNAEIAAELVVGAATVKTHVGHVLTKLGLRDRVQAVILAYEMGLVQARDDGVSPQS